MLYKTTILPESDKELSRKMLNERIHNVFGVLFIVFGKEEYAKVTVDRADALAGDLTEKRYVVWVRNPDDVLDIIKDLDISKKIDWSKQVLSVVTSFADKIRDTRYSTDKPLDFDVIMEAYINGES
jgi:hypothetical protein